jgi:hypothetical protein
VPDFLSQALSTDVTLDGFTVLVRLLFATLFGAVVAWTYKRTRDPGDIAATFPTTLVLLAILIAMVTQVIGDNVARAFSLVGALSIVRRSYPTTAVFLEGLICSNKQRMHCRLIQRQHRKFPDS